jgi:hypothetical protein
VPNFAEPTVLHPKYDDLCTQQDREFTMYSMIHRVASVVSKLMLQWPVPKESINCEQSRFITHAFNLPIMLPHPALMITTEIKLHY